MLALTRCSTALRWSLSLRCSALSLGSTAMSSQPSTAARTQFLRTQTALLHQSRATASPDKPASVLSTVSGLEGALFGLGMWSLGLGAVGAALAGVFLANTDLCLPKAVQATLENLEEADLRSTRDDENVIKAKSLWDKNGAVVMAVRRPG
uniref:Peroxiredoxin-like 2 activated in M-CSF stimulated monocytes n=3 Tax=Cyclopterus lumpus TaxID=8103 RepID=A0A8C2ZII9_CYCLU